MTPGTLEGEKVTLPSLPYVIFIIGLYSLGVIISGIYRHPSYLKLNTAKLIVQVFLDVFLYSLNICVILTTLRKKRKMV